ncbi:MAG: fatty acid desaturase [Hyphomicrobiaceae bacterium]
MSHTATIAAPVAATEADAQSHVAPLSALATALATTLSGYFFLSCAYLYWLAAAGGAVFSRVLPRSIIERAPLTWLTVSALLMAAATQTLPGFWPDYSNPAHIGLELMFWISAGLFGRAYLIYTDFPSTFEGLKAAIEERPLDRWISKRLHHPIDAIFTRVWVANSVAVIPLTVLVLMPSTLNYFVVLAYFVALLIAQFPHELIDHVNLHTRVFQPKAGTPENEKRILKALQVYFEYPHQLLLARAPEYHRIQHVYVHHVEDNGLLDSQTTAPYDRTSFTDFSRHALIQGLDMVSGYKVFSYLAKKGKKRQMRELARGFVIWYGFLAAVAVINPLAAALIWVSRFVGGNMLSLVAFWQHGLVDDHDIQDAHGNSVNFLGHEHGNLGSDYHVEHHLQPGRHWSAYYSVFSKQVNSEAGHGAVLMQKEIFGPLAFVSALWRRDYAAIAQNAHLSGVDLNDKAALAAIVAERTQPFGVPERTGTGLALDRAVSRVMALVLPTRFQV